ncbi:amidase [Streptomyces albipurpureus]|uniref:Amidase family protein n=1 Tax=Streptomyces albipurpureus TaxID=2897419 RepID=A0ABT0UJE0_9ACTN|nr:amidase family protein [Streptomyces sp. CWNU-1]MCM2388367.1 amidase family protein [Streptomyces sp. CWNU-1]
MDDLRSLTAVQLTELIRSRAVSPVEVVRSSLERIEQLNPAVNAFVTVCADKALASAKEAERAVMSGGELGPLHGIPIGVKDLDPVAGVRLTRGSRLFAEDLAQETILCVERLVEAGAIVVGKTNTPEFGFKATTDSSLSGPASTPFNLAMNAGGSSGGSAAAVATGMVPLAQGSDAGGSLRVPGAFCGVFTMMTTFGRVAVPARPNAFRRLNPMVCYAPLARTVEDAVLGLDLMSGPHPRDPYSFPVNEALAEALAPSLAGMRVAYIPDLGGYPVEPEVEAVVRSALPALKEAGAEIVEVDFRLPLPHAELTAMWRRYLSLCHAESAEVSRGQGIDLLGEQGQVVDPGYLESVRVGAALSAVDFRLGDLVRTQILDAFEDLFDAFDLVVSPVNCVAGIPNDTTRTTVGPRQVAGQDVDEYVGWSMTSPFNLIGSPAATVPVGRSANGVPVGMQIAARRHNDAAVVRGAAACQEHLPWQHLYQELDPSLATR